MRKPLAHCLRGFTLIELMVVVILIGVVAAMIVPQLSGSAETVRLESAARRVADMMDFCFHSAASSGRVHAMVFDQVARQFDVVCEPAAPIMAPADGSEMETLPAPAEGVAEGEAAPVATASEPASESASTVAAAGADPNATAMTGSEAAATDQAAQLGLTRVRLPGFLDRTLPEGVGLSGVETFETDLSMGEEEGQFKILFFPDGTTEFAKVELSLPTGQRRVVVLNGIGGTISIFDPVRHGEVDMMTLITDEDNPEELSETDMESESEAGSEPAMGNGGDAMGGNGMMGNGGGGGGDLFGAPAGQ